MFRLFRVRKYWEILLTQVFLIVVATFMEDHPVLYILFAISLFGIGGSLMRVVWIRPAGRVVAIVVAVVAIVSSLLWAVPGISEKVYMNGFLVAAFAYAAFVLLSIVVMSMNVFVTDRITSDRIVGSICIYLLIGLFFAFIFAGLDVISTAAFSFTNDVSGIEDFRDFIYFSYITLTNTGYGDMVPVSPLARTLAAIEGITGTIYLVVMVARLVGMHINLEIRKNLKS